MIYMTIFIILLITSFFPQLLHPLAIVGALLLLTILISLSIRILIQFPWTAYILFLIILGGLLVLFIYIASLAPNRKIFKISFLTPYFLFLLIFLIRPQSYKDLSLSTVSTIINLKKLYLPIACNITILLTVFLLFTLIVVVSVAKTNRGPLRLYSYGPSYTKNAPLD